jgi:hypothetical protein
MGVYMRLVKLKSAFLGLLTVTAIAIGAPAAVSWATGRGHTTATAGKACGALASDLQANATGVQQSLLAVPPTLDAVPKLMNGLLDQVTSLVDLGCLPAPQLPAAAAPVGHTTEGRIPGVPLPTLVPTLVPTDLPTVVPTTVPTTLPTELPGVPGLPTVDTCTDLTADLLAAISDTLAALLSTGLPDLTAAVEAVTHLVDTLTKLIDPAAACLPAPTAS